MKGNNWTLNLRTDWKFEDDYLEMIEENSRYVGCAIGAQSVLMKKRPTDGRLGKAGPCFQPGRRH